MINRESVERVARESGFRKDSVEKVMRLCRILRRLDSHPTTEGAWLLKGGTALNLLHLDVPRMSVDIDLNFIGAVDREGMVSARPGFEAALAAVCEREGCTVKRTPSEHAGGKFTALVQRTVARDAFDAANLLQSIPDLLEDAEFRLAFVCSVAGGRHDPRCLEPSDPAPTAQAIRQQLLPMLQQNESPSSPNPDLLQEELQAQLKGVAERLFHWSSVERKFLDRLHDEGEVDATILHSDPEVQQRIQTQPMLLWKAQNVRQHRKGAS